MAIEPNRNVYVGHRYVPKLMGEWDNSESYEGLCIVTYKGASYTSKKRVPVGIDIENEEYWTLTGNYNAQIEYYRDDVKNVKDELTKKADTIFVNNQLEELEQTINNTVSQFKTDINKDVSDFKEEVNTDISNIDEKINKDVSQFKTDINKDVSDFKEEVNTDISNIDDKINKIVDPVKSDFTVSNARKKFIEKMNEKAKIYGMENTNFSNPHGLYDFDNFTTPKDMVLMGLNAMTYKDITRIWGRHSYEALIEGSRKRKINVEHTITPSSVNDDFIVAGGKTGSLSKHDTLNLLSLIKSKNTNDWLLSFAGTTGSSRYTSTREGANHGITSLRNNGRKVIHHVSNLSNGDFNLGLQYWNVANGNPKISKKEFHSHPQSLKCWGSTSQQLSRGTLKLTPGNIYYVRAYVKCLRYSAGNLGIAFTSSTGYPNASVSRVTEGWELVSSRFVADGNTSFFAGSFNSADLDGYIDTIEMINLTTEYGSGNEPTQSEMDNLLTGNVSGTYSYVVEAPSILNGFNPDNINPLFEKNANDQIFPASVTKIMTAMVFLDYVKDLDQKIMVDSTDHVGGSGSDVYTGDIMTVNDALHLMLLESNNTISHTLERIAGMHILTNEKYKGV